MSKIEVDNVVPQSGTNINLGESGDTVTVPAGVTLDTTNSTVTLPDGSVTNAKLQNSSISINGSSVSLGGSTTIETGTSWQSTIVTGTTLSAVAGNGYWIDTTSNACTVTLPASASVGDTIEFADYARKWGLNAVTLNQNGLNFQGATSPNPFYTSNGQHVTIVYSGSTQGWIPKLDSTVNYETPSNYTADFLVIGGGGGASGNRSGGAGAGGYRNSYNFESSGGGGSAESSITLTGGQTYTITIGAGGTGDGATGVQDNGDDSSISGYGITTITSLGGGAGGTRQNNNGASGGSGGGASNDTSAFRGNGTANQGYRGGDNGTNDNETAAGGGGAGAIGNDGQGASSGRGNGGNGVASTITGSSVYRAGGGGGGAGSTQPAGSGGTGGGGAGGAPATGGSNGTANTGGGAGGGGDGGSTQANGGSGVVILRIPDGNYSGTTTGSPTVTTGVGGTDTVLVFTGSGSYTA